MLIRQTLHCNFGPQDYRHKEAKACAKDPKKRVKRTEYGLSDKVGCTAHYGWVVQPGSEDIGEIKYYNPCHASHGAGEQVGIALLLDQPLHSSANQYKHVHVTD